MRTCGSSEKIVTRLLDYLGQRGGSAKVLEDLEPKLNLCRKSFIEWIITKFKRNVIEINKARKRLKTLSEHILNEEE